MQVYSADDAWRNAASQNPFSRWLAAGNAKYSHLAAARRLKNAIFLPNLTPRFTIRFDDKIFCIGSCFTRDIEIALAEKSLQCLSIPENSPGLFNKFTIGSMLTEFRWALDPETPFLDAYLLEHADGAYSDLHTAVGSVHVPLDEALGTRHQIAAVMHRLTDADVLIVMLTSVEAWYDNHTALYLSQAPSYAFVRGNPGRVSLHILGYMDNLQALEEMHELLLRHAPSIRKIILAVSPAPFTSTFSAMDVVVADSYSKSTLRAVAQDFANTHENVEYVPFYEAVINSAVSVAWGFDRLHVTNTLVRANVLNFLSSYLEPCEIAQRSKMELTELLRHYDDPGGGWEEASLRGLPDFETVFPGDPGFPAGIPRVAVSSRFGSYGASGLAAGPLLPWHAEIPVVFPQTIDIVFDAPFKPIALWLQNQAPNLGDRAPGKFILKGLQESGEWVVLVECDCNPTWGPTGWASWPIDGATPCAAYILVIAANCGHPELLTLRRLWLEPAQEADLLQQFRSPPVEGLIGSSL